MNADIIRSLFEYNAWSHRLVWDCVMQAEESIWTRSSGYSLDTLQAQYVHVLSVDQRWFARVQNLEPPARLEVQAYPTRTSLWSAWEATEQVHRADLAQVTDADMTRIIEYDLPHRGGLKRNTAWEILAHVVNHGTDHRAQILATLHMLGAPTTEQDMMFYWWSR
ncbi:MAG: DinB family protein [Anaerolineae bacterium]|nr:DinB family protein [Anaerolineae bacterium]